MTKSLNAPTRFQLRFRRRYHVRQRHHHLLALPHAHEVLPVLLRVAAHLVQGGGLLYVDLPHYFIGKIDNQQYLSYTVLNCNEAVAVLLCQSISTL